MLVTTGTSLDDETTVAQLRNEFKDLIWKLPISAKVYINGQEVSIIDNNGSVEITLDLDLGENRFELVLQDTQGNESEMLVFTVNVDRKKPNKPILSVPKFVNSDRFNIDVKGEPDTVIKINGISSGIIIPKSGKITIELDLNDGNRSVSR